MRSPAFTDIAPENDFPAFQCPRAMDRKPLCDLLSDEGVQLATRPVQIGGNTCNRSPKVHFEHRVVEFGGVEGVFDGVPPNLNTCGRPLDITRRNSSAELPPATSTLNFVTVGHLSTVTTGFRPVQHFPRGEFGGDTFHPRPFRTDSLCGHASPSIQLRSNSGDNQSIICWRPASALRAIPHPSDRFLRAPAVDI